VNKGCVVVLYLLNFYKAIQLTTKKKITMKAWKVLGILLLTLLIVIIFSYGGYAPLHRYENAARDYRRRCHNGGNSMCNIVVTCTTIPGSWDSLRRTLYSVMSQRPAPREIFVNIPPVCLRTNEKYIVPLWLTRGPFTLLSKVQDTGPSTKYLATLKYLQDNQRGDQAVLVIDDDTIMSPGTLRFLSFATQIYPNCAITYGGKVLPTIPHETHQSETSHKYPKVDTGDGVFSRSVAVFSQPTWRSIFQKHGFTQNKQYATQHQPSINVDIIMGHSTYVIRPNFFDLKRLSDYKSLPPQARFVDDIVISGCLRERGIECAVVHGWPEPLKEFHNVYSDLYHELTNSTRSKALHNSVNRSGSNDDIMIKYFWSV
jgi:hypothetical protein